MDVKKVLQDNTKLISITFLLFVIIVVASSGLYFVISGNETDNEPKNNDTNNKKDNVIVGEYPGVNKEDEKINVDTYIESHINTMNSINSYNLKIDPNYNNSFSGNIKLKKRGDNIYYKKRKVHNTKPADYSGNIYTEKYYDGKNQYVRQNTVSAFTDNVKYDNSSGEINPERIYPKDNLKRLLNNLKVRSIEEDKNTITMLLKPKNSNNLADIHNFDSVSLYTMKLESNSDGLIESVRVTYTGNNKDGYRLDYGFNYNIEPNINSDNIEPSWVDDNF